MSIVSNAEAISFLGLAATDTLLPLMRGPAEAACKRYIGWDPERSQKTEYYAATERGGDEFYFLGDWGSHSSVGGRHNIVQLRRKWVLASGLTVSEFVGAYAGQNDDTSWDELTRGDEYVLDLDDDNLSESGHLIRLGADWPRQRGSIKVVYTAGFTATELSGSKAGATDYTDASDLKYAVYLAIAKAYNEAKAQQKQGTGRASGALLSETVPDYSYTVDGAASRTLKGMSTDLPPAVTMILDRYRSYNAVI